MFRRIFFSWAVFCTLMLFAGQAQAYIGPGSGISAIGSLLSVLGAGFLILVGFVWYPVKRVLKILRGKRDGS